VRIVTRRRTQPVVGDLNETVWICTTVETPDDYVSTIVENPGVFKCHARIRNIKPDQILNYQAVFGTQEKPPTIEITIRFPPDVAVDLNHRVYRETGAAKIWYRVRSVEDLGGAHRFLIMNCSIDVVKDSRNDDATQQPAPRWDTPSLRTLDRF
jgi:hypothetical protein